jgi:hypothetical protein
VSITNRLYGQLSFSGGQPFINNPNLKNRAGFPRTSESYEYGIASRFTSNSRLYESETYAKL